MCTLIATCVILRSLECIAKLEGVTLFHQVDLSRFNWSFYVSNSVHVNQICSCFASSGLAPIIPNNALVGYLTIQG